MSDLVINVRQIGNYPARQQSDGQELVLVQAGGLGGPYQALKSSVLVSTALNQSSLGVGAAIPAYAVAGQVFSDTLVVPRDGTLVWNAYASGGGATRYWLSGGAGALGWDQALGFRLSSAPSGAASSVLTAWVTQFQLKPDGSAALPVGTLTVARDGRAPNEVVTRRQMQTSTVANFMGRTGAVRLEGPDIYRALGLKSEIATNETILQRIQELLAGHPFVWSMNGRTGNVWLQVADLNHILLKSDLWGETRTPPVGDRSLKIANTKWVVDFAYGKFWQDIQHAIETIPEGPEGPEGPVGPQGPTGSGFNFRGMLPTASDLPASGNEQGDLFITQDTNTGYVWDPAGDVWQPMGIISPSARVFMSDTAPLVATDGDLWWDTSTGELSVYYQGPSGFQWVVANTGQGGPQGPPGQQGIPGTPGVPGPDVWVGTNPPASPTVGRLWFNPAAGSTAVYDGSTWLPVSEPGATVSVGATPPASPKDGDLWWDATDGQLMVWYVGPSAVGQWVIANPGEMGPVGPAGPIGPAGPQGTQGVQGPPGQGINLRGSVATFGALPGSGQANGDAYVTQDTNQLWVWDGTNWELIGIGGGIGEAPTDGAIYGRRNLLWEALMDDGAY